MAGRCGRTSCAGWGAAIGALATVGLTGWLYLAHAWLRLPFVPFDIADAIIRLAPGSLATAGIEALGEGAKPTLMALGLALTLAAGSGLGALAAARGLRGSSAGRWLRWLALVAAALGATVAVEAVIAWNQAPVVAGLAGLALSYAVWAGVVAAGVDAAGQPALRASGVGGEAAGPASAGGLVRRGFLLRFAAASLASALAGLLLGTAGRAVRGNQATARPLPPPPADAEQALQAAAGDGRGDAVQATTTTGPAAAAAEAGPVSGAASPVPATPTAAVPAATPTLAPGSPPPPGTPLPAFTPAAGTRPNLTPLPDFYVVNIATRDPISDVNDWRLTVAGLVDRPLDLTYGALLRLPRVDVYATQECISNPVAGRLIGTAQFNGARLADVLAQAGVQRGAVELVTRSLDGYTESLPLDKALDPATLLVYGMNGLTLEQRHGYPLRLYNPNHYGMRNPKWLQSLELAPEAHAGYWEERGWDREAVVKTTSMLDTRGELPAAVGVVQLGGIAFAGWRGIQAVQVNIDNTGWRDAALDGPLSRFTWVRWRLDWRDARPGPHDVIVRAVDGAGEEQTNFIAAPHPDGASGWHKVHILVS